MPPTPAGRRRLRRPRTPTWPRLLARVGGTRNRLRQSISSCSFGFDQGFQFGNEIGYFLFEALEQFRGERQIVMTSHRLQIKSSLVSSRGAKVADRTFQGVRGTFKPA